MRPGPRTRREAAERAVRVAELQRYRWRVGLLEGHWRVARHGPDVAGWELLPDRLQHFDDIDPVAERRRYVSWLWELLGCTSVWLDLDYRAANEGRTAYVVTILR